MQKLDLKNTYVISDIHGCYYTMLALIKKLPSNANLIFVGDLCDRGLYSKKVIEFVKNNNYPCILGNHDFYLLDNIEDCLNGAKVRWNTKEYMGGLVTIDNYKNDLDTLKEHLEWIKTLPQYLIIENYFITHAFCMPYFKRRDDKSKTHAMMTNRISDKDEWDWDWEKDWKKYEYINIYGHESSKNIVRKHNYICIDTACVYGGKLSALNLDSLEVIQQDLIKKDVLL